MKHYFFALKQKLKKFALSKKIPSGKYFLIGTPDYNNLGDNMIAIAELDFIKKQKNIKPIELTPQLYYYFKDKIKNASDVTLYLQGGGNIGNEYMREEELRRDIIKTFNKCKIIIFPQTIYFSKEEEAQKSANIYGKHNNLYITCREKYSYDIAKKLFHKNTIILTPDIVLSYKTIKKKTNSTKKSALFILRNDVEKIDNTKKLNQITNYLQHKGFKIMYADTITNDFINQYNRKTYISKFFKKISNNAIVVTDRLHGMIFSYLNKVPCLTLNNYNYKIIGTYEWIKNENQIQLAGSNYQEQIDILLSNGIDSIGISNKFDSLIRIL